MATKPEEKNSWIGTTDFLFSFCEEKKPENGEDSFVFSLNESRTLLGVFDGCGGSGARRPERWATSSAPRYFRTKRAGISAWTGRSAAPCCSPTGSAA